MALGPSGLAWAGDTGSASAGDQDYMCIPTFESTDPDSIELSWQTGSEDDLVAVLTVRTLDREGWSYRLRGRLRFRGIDQRWTQDLGVLDAYSQEDIVLDAAALVSWSDGQSDWTSDLEVQVVAIDPDGNKRLVQAAAPLQVIWVGSEARVVTFDAAVALAPHGAWSAAAQAVDPASAEDATLVRVDGTGVDLDAVGR